MKKIVLILTSVFLVTGFAFADGGKKKAKTTCNKHEGKTCGKDMKQDDKAVKDTAVVKH